MRFYIEQEHRFVHSMYSGIPVYRVDSLPTFAVIAVPYGFDQDESIVQSGLSLEEAMKLADLEIQAHQSCLQAA